MKIALIAAHDPDLVIGKDGTLPWHYPEDLAHFKKTTMGLPVIMGRGVFEELGKKPLPGRRNIVLTRSANYDHVEVCRNKDEVLKKLQGEELVYIIGGAQIYKLFLQDCDILDITLIHRSYNGDTFFPEYRDKIGTVWNEVNRMELPQLTFVVYQRISGSN